MKLLTRWGVLIEEQGQTYMADNDSDSDEARALRPLQAAACTYRVAFGPRAGQKVLTVQGTMPRETGFKQKLCADMNGFSLHAAVRCGADDRQALEQLCRTITRPALANERVQCNAAEQVVLTLKTPWRDGATHLVMSPLEFMQRLAALVPRPRLQALPRLGKRTIRDRAQQRFATAHRGEEAIEHGLLGWVAHRQQRADQRGQRQLAAAREGAGEVGVSRELRKVVRGDLAGQLKCQALYKLKGYPFSSSNAGTTGWISSLS